MSRILVTGGVRSGKSAHAEAMVGRMPGDVIYVAAGPTYDDADWAVRVARHRERRPAQWRTVETRDLVGVIHAAGGPVLIDCLGTWLQNVLDEAGAWEASIERAEDTLAASLDALVAAVAAAGPDADLVLVTNEVGLGVVPEHRSGRVFRDLLGIVNQRVGAVCDHVHLVVAGRVLEI